MARPVVTVCGLVACRADWPVGEAVAVSVPFTPQTMLSLAVLRGAVARKIPLLLLQ